MDLGKTKTQKTGEHEYTTYSIWMLGGGLSLTWVVRGSYGEPSLYGIYKLTFKKDSSVMKDDLMSTSRW